jgi:integrase/recombinase XerD
LIQAKYLNQLRGLKAMKEKQISLEMLTGEVVDYLQKLAYSHSRISQYRSAWQRLALFMRNKGLKYYNATVGDAFIYHLIGTRAYDNLDRWEKDIIQCANVLTEFHETGTVKFRRNQKFRELHGAIGQTMLSYIEHKKSYGICRETAEEYKKNFQHFLNYLNENEISGLNSINQPLLLNYTNHMGFFTPNSRHRNTSVIKGYLRYVYDQKLTELDCSRMLPRDKYIRQPKLPSTYSKEEVDALLAAIDRSSPKGKRDYAMVLITARLGLRASDVCNLTFENIQWEKNLIVLNPQKTQVRIELPLLSGIGEAIIDYLKYGRPSSVLPFIFLHVIPPYDRLNRSTLHSIVCFYLRRAGVHYEKKRKHGPHALRHSLAGVLLEKKTPLPIISQVLGHKNTESTRFYLRIDLNSLRQCALEVPPVSYSFYERGLGR